LEVAQAQVQLEVLRVKQANDGVTLAVLQQGRAQIQADHFQKLLDDGLLEAERGVIETLGEAAILQATAADLSFAAAAVYGAVAVVGRSGRRRRGFVYGPL
jgi:serine/threonine-protein kinase RIO1